MGVHRENFREQGADEDGGEDGEEREDEALPDLECGGEAVAHWDGAGGNGEDVGAVGADDGRDDIGDRIQPQRGRKADNDGDRYRSGSCIAGNL